MPVGQLVSRTENNSEGYDLTITHCMSPGLCVVMLYHAQSGDMARVALEVC